MHTSLSHITTIIKKYTAFEYAALKLREEKSASKLTLFNSETSEIKEVEVSYEEYMRETWNNLKDATLEDCIENSRVSKLRDYAEMIKLYTGWIKNGKVFVLNTEEKFVSFLYHIKTDNKLSSGTPERVDVYTHYNPLDVDCIEESISPKYLDSKLENEKYQLSKNEQSLIDECDRLIKEG